MPVIEYFPYSGPNRRSDKTVVEIMLKFSPGEEQNFPQHASEIKQLLINSGILTVEENFPEQALPDEWMAWYSSLLVQTALLFQRKAGHRVSFFSVSSFPEQEQCTALVEHEHCDVGITAVKLANELISGQRKLLAEPFGMFRAFAHDRRLPVDTGAIINAARRRDIPCSHLERFPLMRNNAQGDCIRLNGLVLFGHGIYQHILDGTFCPDKSRDFKGLLKNRNRRLELLKRLGIPVIQAAEGSAGIAGEYYVIAVNGQVTAVISKSDGELPDLNKVAASTLETVLKINQAVGLAPVVVTLRTTEISKPLEHAKSGVADFELAPNLEHFDSPDSNLMTITAEAIIDWLFPAQANSRMPTIAVTGTNGKTTTCRMINHILLNSGRKPGLVCTDGLYLQGRMVSDGDNCTMKGHFEVLASKEADIAVLETHHYGILVRGFAFRWCDIAVCLNVTEDHLGVVNIETVEQMAKVKGALLERARHAAILNADDPHCLAMLESTTAETTCLVSMVSGLDFMAELVDRDSACFCILEDVEDEEWLVLYDRGQRLPVMATARIPAAFNATARFNVCNAMHAAAAAYLAGTEIEKIAAAMSSFTTAYDSTPGRMNIFDELPFRIVMDFAHNPDGMLKLSDFIDQQDVTGRKMIAFSGSADRKDSTLKNMTKSLAGHFDFYFCKEFVSQKVIKPRNVAHILQQGLIEAGVAENQTMVTTNGKDVIFEIFDACKAGDLLVMLMGHVEKHQLPAYIREYAGQLALGSTSGS